MKEKTLSELSEGDKVYIYDLNGSSREVEVKYVGPINEYGYSPVRFKGSSLYNILLPRYTGYFYIEEDCIYSTIGNLNKLFGSCYKAGGKNMRYQLRCMLGIDE